MNTSQSKLDPFKTELNIVEIRTSVFRLKQTIFYYTSLEYKNTFWKIMKTFKKIMTRHDLLFVGNKKVSTELHT